MTVYTKTMMEALAEVRGLQEDNMDLMRKAAGGSMQTIKMKDGKLKMDSFTASALMQVYDKVNPKNKKAMEQIINSGKTGQIVKLQSIAMKAIKSENDPEIEEEVDLEEGKMKELHGYIAQGKSAEWIAKKMGVGVKTIKSLMDEYGEETDLDEAYELGTDEYREYLEKLTPGQIEEEISELDNLIKELDEGILGNLAKAAGKTVAKGVKVGAKKVGGAIKRKTGGSKIGKTISKVKSGIKKTKAIGGKIKKAAKTGKAYGDEYDPMLERLEIIETKLNDYYKILEELDLEGVELDEASARADAARAMHKDRDLGPRGHWDDVGTDASDADIKAASKNILAQMRKVVSLGGRFDVEFLDKKKVRVKPAIANAFIRKYEGLRRPADKEKFQNQAIKSYKDMLSVLKAGYNEEVELDEGTKQVLAHGGKGQYKVTKDGDNIEIKFKGKVVGTADFDRGADSFFVSIKGEKGQKSFDDAQAIADYFAKNKIKEELELDEKTKWKMGDGRPRGGAYIENERFWDLDRDALLYIMKDADTAMKANPTGSKAGKYADEVNDAHTVLGWRKKNGIKEEVELDDDLDEALPSHLQKYFDKDGNPKSKEGKAAWERLAKMKGFKKYTSQQVKMAIGIAFDKRFVQGNMTGAVNAIEKIAKGLSEIEPVANALKRANENTILDRIDRKLKERKNG